MESDVIICRCEDVRRSEIETAIQAGASDINSIKRMTRAGMGTCQGAYCELLILRILAQGRDSNSEIQTLKKRPPVRPVEMGEIARIESSQT